jgi:hypothetical protein
LQNFNCNFSEFNKIKFLNGKAFQGLNKLTRVKLNGNVCIDDHFSDPTRIADMQQTVNEKCSIKAKYQILEVSFAKSNVTIATLIEHNLNLIAVTEDFEKQLKKAQELCRNRQFMPIQQ